MTLSHVGFCGLGLMKKKGFTGTAWNRPKAAEALKAHGILTAATPKDLAASVDAICTCVAV